MVTAAGVDTILMLPSTHVQLETTADAMASKDLAGLGGAAFFPDGSVVWFQFQIRLSETQSAWDWVGDDVQKHIATWEILAQYALWYCIDSRLPRSRGPISCHQAIDNSAADTASSQGLAMTQALAVVPVPYVTFMRRFQIFPSICHIPGRLNLLADDLSRFNNLCRLTWTLRDFATSTTWRVCCPKRSKVALAFRHPALSKRTVAVW